jgi:hypothetical protein
MSLGHFFPDKHLIWHNYICLRVCGHCSQTHTGKNFKQKCCYPTVFGGCWAQFIFLPCTFLPWRLFSGWLSFFFVSVKSNINNTYVFFFHKMPMEKLSVFMANVWSQTVIILRTLNKRYFSTKLANMTFFIRIRLYKTYGSDPNLN